MLADRPCIGTESALILDWMTGLEGGGIPIRQSAM